MIAAVVASASGDTPVVAAVTGKKITVKQLCIYNGVATANSVKLRSGTTDLHVAVPLPLVVGGQINAQESSDAGDFLAQTAQGAALNINLSAATAVAGFVTYSLD